ncbi:hypothetical protein LTR66_000526 [Elasticomyces elasticus]|nr:hypothetical protein LTR66_000526 [Elasticomyces elasticus]
MEKYTVENLKHSFRSIFHRSWPIFRRPTRERKRSEIPITSVQTVGEQPLVDRSGRAFEVNEAPNHPVTAPEGSIAEFADELRRAFDTRRKTLEDVENIPLASEKSFFSETAGRSPKYRTAATQTGSSYHGASTKPRLAFKEAYTQTEPTTDLVPTQTEHEHEQMPVEAQAIDEESSDIAYYFDGEDETDYTDGPPKMVVANDGIKQCAAMLFTLDLSAKLQLAVKLDREIHQTEREIEFQERQLTTEKEELLESISSIEAQLAATLSPLMGQEHHDDYSEQHREVREMEKEIARLRERLQENDIRLGCLVEQLEHMYNQQRAAQADVNAALEQVLVDCQLLEPCPEPAEHQDERSQCDNEDAMGNDAGELQADLGDWDDATHPRSDEDPDTYIPYLHEEEDSPEERQFHIAYVALDKAERAFEGREDRFAQEIEEIRAAALDGKKVESPLQVELRQLHEAQRLTRALIDAQAVYEKAVAGARDAGIDLRNYEIEFDFCSAYPDDDLVSEGEEEPAGLGDILTVKKWMKSIPSDANEDWMGAPEIDDWAAHEVDVSDSISAVAEGSERKRIDRWLAGSMSAAGTEGIAGSGQ